jgi:hypothetical protein
MRRNSIANWLLQIANCKLNGFAQAGRHAEPVQNIRSRPCLRTILFAFVGIVLLSLASIPSFADSVSSNIQKGIEEYHNRDFSAAIKSFEEAENAAPDDLRPVFDRGCVLAAQGELDKASEQFKKSAAAKDRKLAALSHYNLGCLAIQQANKKLSNKPEDAEGGARVEALQRIDAAIGHFRDALKANPQDENARHNLETLAAWKTYMQKAWNLRDRQKRREKMNLFEHLQMIETEQRSLSTKVIELRDIAQDSPKKRQSVRETAAAQRDLLSEIGPLKEKIDQAAAGQSKEAVVNVQEAIAALKNGADEIGKSMQSSADLLAENRLPESLEPQTAAIEDLDHLFAAVSPYVNLVQKGITRQEELLKTSSLPKGEEPGVRADQENKTTSATNQEKVLPDYSDSAWNQRFIERYAKIIPIKARQELERLESQPSDQPSALKPPENGEPKPDKSANEPKNAEDEKTEARLQAEEQKRSLKETLQLSLELAPKVEQLAGEAADSLSQEKPANALPKQQECLKLLKEMLPKELQKKEEEKKEQEKKCKECEKNEKNNEKKKCEQCEKKDKEKQGNKDSDNNEKDKKDQDKKGKDQKDQNQKEQDKDKREQGKEKKQNGQEKKEQEKQGQAKQNDKDKEKSPKSSPQKKSQQPGEGGTASLREMSPKQAEALMKQAQERHKMYLEYQNEVQRALSQPENVDKDW